MLVGFILMAFGRMEWDSELLRAINGFLYPEVTVIDSWDEGIKSHTANGLHKLR